MPLKKGTKKSTKSESGGSVEVAREEETFPELDIRPERWVNLKVKLVTWDHLDFQVVLKTSTRLYTIVDKVKERHGGSIQDVILYRHQVHPQNILLDLGCTLDEVGFDGGPRSDPKEEVICYDYQAHESDCPLLLSSPRGASRKDVVKKVATEAEDVRRVNLDSRPNISSSAARAGGERRKSLSEDKANSSPTSPAQPETQT